jgi:hypothetical protein
MESNIKFRESFLKPEKWEFRGVKDDWIAIPGLEKLIVLSKTT